MGLSPGLLTTTQIAANSKRLPLAGLFVMKRSASALFNIEERTRMVKSMGAPGLAFETWDPSNQFSLETPNLLFVIPSACDCFDLFVLSAYPTSFISSPRQSRHPERSASQIYRKQRTLWRVVEGPRRCSLADAIGSFPAANHDGI